ncbi:MAG: hypothetical protein V1743_01985 [Nanoarchaeota archaeon]
MQKPSLTEPVLEQLVTLVQINQRFRDINGTRPPDFEDLLMKARNRYEQYILPALVQYAQYYQRIKQEIDTFEALYKRT